MNNLAKILKQRGYENNHIRIFNILNKNSMSFLEAFEEYNSKISTHRNNEDKLIIEKLTIKIKFKKNTQLVGCIPCHIDEIIDFGIISKLAKMYEAEDDVLIIFLNGYLIEYSNAAFEARVSEVKQKFTENCGNTSIILLSHLFKEKPNIGKIRGLLTDSVATAAYKYKLLDPIVISNDIDVLSLSSNYLKSCRQVFSTSKIDLAVGPTYYGCTPGGLNFIKYKFPELLLSNRFINALRQTLLDGKLVGFPYVMTEGPNTAFRLSSYCRVEGYNYLLKNGEDDAIGASLWIARGGENCNNYVPQYAAQLDDMWLVTDPRRQLRALNLNYSIRESWRHEPFETNPGHDFDLDELHEDYKKNTKVLKISRLEELVAINNHNESMMRILEVFKGNIISSGLTLEESSEVLAPLYGLKFKPESTTGWTLSDNLLEAFKVFATT